MIVAIADDLTGAAEVAGSALRMGLSAEVHIGNLYASDADVVVVDADTRSCSAESAAEIMCGVVNQVSGVGASLVFKKVDSILRGPVLAELQSIQHTLQLPKCLLVCGNPRKGRTVADGRILIHGIPLDETEFANDPEHPRCSSHAVELLKKTIGPGDAAVNAFGASLDVVAPGVLSDADISIGNVANQADLDRHAELWQAERDTLLPAGGAEFFEAIVRQWLGAGFASLSADPSAAAALSTGDEILLISGSTMTTLHDWPRIQFEPGAEPVQCVSEVCQTLMQRGRAAIRAVDLSDGSPSDRMEQLIEISIRVLAACRPGQVWIEGGRTASTLMRALHCRRLIPMSNFGDGVVALRASDGESPLYLIKPGSYPWPCDALTGVLTPSRHRIAERAG